MNDSNVKELIDKMHKEDEVVFVSAVNKNRPSFIDQNTFFDGIPDMIECVFIWRNTERGQDFWEGMANHYKKSSKNEGSYADN